MDEISCDGGFASPRRAIPQERTLNHAGLNNIR